MGVGTAESDQESMKKLVQSLVLISAGGIVACSGDSTDSAGEDGGDESSGDESGDDGGEGGEGGDEDGVQVSSFSVNTCQGDTGSMPSGDDALSASVDGGVISVVHLAVEGNCCPYGWDIGVVAEGSELNVWYHGDGDCDCNCLYDLEYDIAGAESGTWTLNAGGSSLEVTVP